MPHWTGEARVAPNILQAKVESPAIPWLQMCCERGCERGRTPLGMLGRGPAGEGTQGHYRLLEERTHGRSGQSSLTGSRPKAVVSNA